MVQEGLITKEEALLKVEPTTLDQLLHDTFDEEDLKTATPVAQGLAASPGAACGRIYFNAKDVEEATKNKEKTILVRTETSPEDITGMKNACGILTVHGGMTSHAAVVARGMGRCCVSGCTNIVVNEKSKTLTLPNGKVLHEKDILSLDGTTGNVYDREIKTKAATISGNFETFMNWADEVKTLEVRTNADTPKDAETAKNFGAKGIGLCRTEHMFFDKDRIFNFRMMIAAPDLEKRKFALGKILPYQRNDFEKLFEGDSVTIRYLDPPLHEFLPKKEEEIQELAKSLNISYEELKSRIDSLKEFNPMMGHRGCRLAVTYPEITKMQTRALMEAAIEVSEEEGIEIVPEIMIPLVGEEKELKFVKDIVVETAELVKKEKNSDMQYHIGTMIEIPRAALTADAIAKEAEFFSFGTNDLTQMTFGFSRDDAGKFLDSYYQNKIYESDPFAKLDQTGVGQLVEMAVEKGRKTRPNIKLGICGEHGGEPSSIEFCNRIGLDYVSCSPFRVPIARLAAAQAAIKSEGQR